MYLMSIVNKGNSQTAYSCSIGMWNYYKIFNSLYTSNTVAFSYKSISDFGDSATDTAVVNGFDTYVKAKLDSGKPVILHIAKDGNKYSWYHSVVAYYYDASGIHAHFGWGQDSSDVVIPSNYYITEAGSVDFSNLGHKHSNNYVIDDTLYCGCGQIHTHTYTEEFTYTSNTYHKAYCWCGEYENQFHYTDSDHLNSSANTAVCLGCGATIDLSKSPILMTGLSDGVETASVGLNVISSMEQLMQALGLTETEASGEYSYIFEIYNEEFFGKYSIVTEMDIYENSELLKKAIIGTVKSDEYNGEAIAA